MKGMAAVFLAVILACAASGVKADRKTADSPKQAEGTEVTINVLFAHLAQACDSLDAIDEDVAALNDDFARNIAGEWKKTYIYPDFPILCAGRDDPAQLPVRGKHAFVVLGYALQDGEMTEELKGRCDAAAEAARAFPDSVIVCSGGATGYNNPDAHTEAGLMKQYLTEAGGISADRIFTDERALSTADNAVNTFRILEEQEIETLTLVTSSYHQRRAHMLYYLVAEYYRCYEGRSFELIGNFSYETGDASELAGKDADFAMMQMMELTAMLTSR